MTPRTAKWTLAIGLLVFWAILGAVWFVHWDRNRRFEFWQENHYPTTNKFMMQEYCYYPSCEAWAQAGRDIPGVEDRLIAKFADVDEGYDRWLFIYSMAAINSPQSLDFLRDMLFSTDDEDLQTSIINAFYFCGTLGDEGVQAILLDYAKDPRFPAAFRCTLLAEVVLQGNQDSLAYVESHGKDLVLQAWKEGSHIRGVTELNDAWSLGLPPFPTIWELIDEELATIYAAWEALPDESPLAQEGVPASLEAQRRAAAERVARCYGREALAEIVEGFSDPGGHSGAMYSPGQEEDRAAWRLRDRFASEVVAAIVDPHNTQGFELDGYVPSYVMAVQGIDSYQDDWACETLLELADSKDMGGRVFRFYPSSKIRPRAVAALEELEAALADGQRWEEHWDEDPWAKSYVADQVVEIRGLLASLDYADGLDEDTREQYWDFERRFFRSMWVPHAEWERITGTLHATIADRFTHGRGDWIAPRKAGDERFILHILESPASHPGEVVLAAHLVEELSPEARQRLEGIAGRRNSNVLAQQAKRALALHSREESP
jgi:hypothetical protein